MRNLGWLPVSQGLGILGHLLVLCSLLHLQPGSSRGALSRPVQVVPPRTLPECCVPQNVDLGWPHGHSVPCLLLLLSSLTSSSEHSFTLPGQGHSEEAPFRPVPPHSTFYKKSMFQLEQARVWCPVGICHSWCHSPYLLAPSAEL